MRLSVGILLVHLSQAASAFISAGGVTSLIDCLHDASADGM